MSGDVVLEQFVVCKKRNIKSFRGWKFSEKHGL